MYLGNLGDFAGVVAILAFGEGIFLGDVVPRLESWRAFVDFAFVRKAALPDGPPLVELEVETTGFVKGGGGGADEADGWDVGAGVA